MHFLCPFFNFELFLFRQLGLDQEDPLEKHLLLIEVPLPVRFLGAWRMFFLLVFALLVVALPLPQVSTVKMNHLDLLLLLLVAVYQLV